MRLITMVAAIALMTAAGCSSSGSGLPKDETGAPKLNAVAASIGCTNLQPMSKLTMFASEEGHCQLNGRNIDLATFASDKLKRNWLKIVTNFGPLVKDGPGWAAIGPPLRTSY